MNITKIFEGDVTLEELEELNKQGYTFVIQDGKITQIYWTCSLGEVPVGSVN